MEVVSIEWKTVIIITENALLSIWYSMYLYTIWQTFIVYN